MLDKYTIGSDPELFIFNTKTQKVVSAINKIPGSKEEPYKEGLPEGFGLQTDNILAEFNIPVCLREKDFIKNIKFMKDVITGMVKDIDPNLDIICQASAKVPPKELKHPQAKEAGCDPDFCIYTDGPNEPSNLRKTNIRSAGCHLHVGYRNNTIDKSLQMLRYVDVYVGIPSILYDTDVERRNLYGKAGCFRLQPYGFEYRSLSSFWIGTEDRLKFIWRQLEFALYNYECNKVLPSEDIVQSIINNNDVESAKEVIKRYSIIHPGNINLELICVEYLV